MCGNDTPNAQNFAICINGHNVYCCLGGKWTVNAIRFFFKKLQTEISSGDQNIVEDAIKTHFCKYGSCEVFWQKPEKIEFDIISVL